MHNWQGAADLLYPGQYSANGPGYRKTNDRLYLDAKYGYDLTQHGGLRTALNLLAQFAPGYYYAGDDHATFISSFLAPGYLITSFGAEYHPTDRFDLRRAPVAPRVTIVRQPARFRYHHLRELSSQPPFIALFFYLAC